VAEVRVEVEASPLAAVVRGVAAQAEPEHRVTSLIAALTESDFKHMSDLSDVGADDFAKLAPAFAACNSSFVKAFLSHCQSSASREQAAQAHKPGGRTEPQRPASLAAGVAAQAGSASGSAGAGCAGDQTPTAKRLDAPAECSQPPWQLLPIAPAIRVRSPLAGHGTRSSGLVAKPAGATI
ncbi:unnamed protein product, partial [Prorocentrum cordatum]